jgi:hypothetical protein
MTRLDRTLTLSDPAFICVFCVFCGSISLIYIQHNVSNSLTPADSRDRPIVERHKGIRTRCQGIVAHLGACPTARKMAPQITQNTQKAGCL